jgi:hypothetical protein
MGGEVIIFHSGDVAARSLSRPLYQPHYTKLHLVELVPLGHYRNVPNNHYH